MKNLILTTLSDTRYEGFSALPEVEIFFRSAARIPETELVVLSDKLNRPYPHIPVPPSENIYWDRWLYFYQYLSRTHYDQVLIVDSRDVYFQTNPFEYANDQITLTAEGPTHGESGWNMRDQEASQKARGFSIDPTLWPVVNGGVAMGPHDKLRAFCLLAYMLSKGSVTDTDQADINRAWHLYLRFDPDFRLMHPKDSSFCVTGDPMKMKQTPYAHVKNAIAYGETDTPYALFHQWDRTEHREAIFTAFGLSDPKRGEPTSQ